MLVSAPSVYGCIMIKIAALLKRQNCVEKHADVPLQQGVCNNIMQQKQFCKYVN